MVADIWGRSLTICENPQASMLGGTALALCAAGVLKTPGEFRVKETKTVEPRSGANEAYKNKYERYLALYHTLKNSRGF
jgi:sugar (pentulose or hexulose) kinase